MTEISIPEGLWRGTDQGVIAAWLYEDGNEVEKHSVVATLMIEKTQIDIDAPATGTLRILKPAETPVIPGDVIGEIV